MEWDLTNEPQRITEVLSTIASDGPQTIRTHGDEYVVLPKAEYDLLNPPPLPAPTTFKEWLLNMPRIDDLDIERDKSPMREIDL